MFFKNLFCFHLINKWGKIWLLLFWFILVYTAGIVFLKVLGVCFEVLNHCFFNYYFSFILFLRCNWNSKGANVRSFVIVHRLLEVYFFSLSSFLPLFLSFLILVFFFSNFKSVWCLCSGFLASVVLPSDALLVLPSFSVCV